MPRSNTKPVTWMDKGVEAWTFSRKSWRPYAVEIDGDPIVMAVLNEKGQTAESAVVRVLFSRVGSIGRRRSATMACSTLFATKGEVLDVLDERPTARPKATTVFIGRQPVEVIESVQVAQCPSCNLTLPHNTPVCLSCGTVV